MVFNSVNSNAARPGRDNFLTITIKIFIIGMLESKVLGWEEELKRNVKSVEELKGFIELSEDEERALKEVMQIHPMSVSRYYLSLIDRNDKNDPLRKLMIPSIEELRVLEGSYDPSDEKSNTKMPGLQHKYKQTALILSTNRCSSYCRFCFRKRMVGLPNKEVVRRFSDAVDYIRNHEEIDNVLITGGDPLSLPTSVIREFLKMLDSIPHLKYIRFGTRVPAVFPDRIIKDNRLLELFMNYSQGEKKIYIITHFEHPGEITERSREAVEKLVYCGLSLNNQSVLLRGVNDDPNTLAGLFNGLIEMGILPYYLFQCRPVKRVKNYFSVPLHEGCRIFELAKKRLKGHILCKRVKYVMSHTKGKIEIIGMSDKDFYFKYHQPKDLNDSGKCFCRKINKKATWLDMKENLV